MKVNLLGYRTLDFISEGQQIKGTQLFVCYKESGVEGEITDKLFVPEDMPYPPLTPGQPLEITFNRRGKIERIDLPSTKNVTINK